MRVVIRWKPPAPRQRVIIRWKPLIPRQRWLLASAGAVSVIVSAAPAILEFASLSFQSATESTAFTVPAPADLIVSEAGFIGPAERRTIAGVLKNRSGKSYTDIEMIFALVGPDGDTVGSATARVIQLGGHETAKFEVPETSDPTAKAVEIVLKQIEAQPQR
jgi:hypothetical protein